MSHSTTIPIPRSTIRRSNHVYTLWDIFENKEPSEDSNDYQPKFFDSREQERGESTLRFRIPEHQRWPRWTLEAQRKLVDSVFSNMPMQGVTFSHHFDNDAPIGQQDYYDIEDGQTRLSILQAFYNNKFTWYDGRTFQDLAPNQQQRFNSYKFNAEIISEATDEQIHEIFERCQEGVPLRDCDKFWNRKDKSVIQFAIQLITTWNNWRHDYMGTRGFGTRKRQRLPDVVGMIVSLISENGQEYITSSFRSLYTKLDTSIGQHDIDKIHNFLVFYFKLIDHAYTSLQPHFTTYTNINGLLKTQKERRLIFSKIGGYLGMILCDYLNWPDEDNTIKQGRWIQIINIDRCIPDFMRGKRTIFNGLNRRVALNCDATTASIITRVERIRAFSATEENNTRQIYCTKLGIIWNEDNNECNDNVIVGSSDSSITTTESPLPAGDNLEAAQLETALAVSNIECT
tara:strand:- start:345 stop:1715 length:1371 start_codon:yes stop_codon:yes gene_type:complete